MIEIIRDPKPPAAPEVSFPPDLDDSNPLYMLSQLVEKLETIVDRDSPPDENTTDSANLYQNRFPSVASDIERYLELFQKQSAVLRKMMPRLH